MKYLMHCTPEEADKIIDRQLEYKHNIMNDKYRFVYLKYVEFKDQDEDKTKS